METLIGSLTSSHFLGFPKIFVIRFDIHVLLKGYHTQISKEMLKSAYEATAKKRDTNDLINQAEAILSTIENDEHMIGLWKSYCKKYNYAAEIAFEEALASTRQLTEMIKQGFGFE